jgi:hypothetical protein
MVQGPDQGKVDVQLDGVSLGTVDLYNAQNIGQQIVLEKAAVSLDLHRVKIIALGTKNGLSTSPAVTVGKISVMR